MTYTTGDVVLIETSSFEGGLERLRPALVLQPWPETATSLLACWISAHLMRQSDCDIALDASADWFPGTGLKAQSFVRVAAISVVSAEDIVGRIGRVPLKVSTLASDRVSSFLSV